MVDKGTEMKARVGKNKKVKQEKGITKMAKKNNETNQETTTMKSTDATNEIDKALAAAKARVEAKREAGGAAAAPAADKAADTAAKKEARDLARAAAKAAREAKQVEKNAAKELAREEKRRVRAEKKALKEAARAAKGPAHMSKVEKAAAKLPALSDDAQAMLANVTAKLPIDQLGAFAENLQHFVRVQSTKRALDQKLVVGQVVRIVSGNSRFIGQTATVSRVQRIRCYVTLPGSSKEIYLFTSDVGPLERRKTEELPSVPAESAESKTGTNG